ncbi:hypothetical protein ACJX0J_020769, partial [Zea mays]
MLMIPLKRHRKDNFMADVKIWHLVSINYSKTLVLHLTHVIGGYDEEAVVNLIHFYLWFMTLYKIIILFYHKTIKYISNNNINASTKSMSVFLDEFGVVEA